MLKSILVYVVLACSRDTRSTDKIVAGPSIIKLDKYCTRRPAYL